MESSTKVAAAASKTTISTILIHKRPVPDRVLAFFRDERDVLLVALPVFLDGARLLLAITSRNMSTLLKSGYST